MHPNGKKIKLNNNLQVVNPIFNKIPNNYKLAGKDIGTGTKYLLQANHCYKPAQTIGGMESEQNKQGIDS